MLLCFLTGLISSAQNKAANDYTGIEYLQLKSELCRGWNTWNTNSVLSHVLLPEAISVDFYLKDKSTGKVLKEALMGKRGKESENIWPLAHTNNGSYTELDIKWNGIEMKVQSSALGKNICFLLTPVASNVKGEILVCPRKIWWDREGKAGIGKGQLKFELPSGEIVLYAKSKTEIKEDTLLLKGPIK